MAATFWKSLWKNCDSRGIYKRLSQVKTAPEIAFAIENKNIPVIDYPEMKLMDADWPRSVRLRFPRSSEGRSVAESVSLRRVPCGWCGWSWKEPRSFSICDQSWTNWNGLTHEVLGGAKRVTYTPKDKRLTLAKCLRVQKADRLEKKTYYIREAGLVRARKLCSEFFKPWSKVKTKFFNFACEIVFKICDFHNNLKWLIS